mgnify:CR=1 FL=1
MVLWSEDQEDPVLSTPLQWNSSTGGYQILTPNTTRPKYHKWWLRVPPSWNDIFSNHVMTARPVHTFFSQQQYLRTWENLASSILSFRKFSRPYDGTSWQALHHAHVINVILSHLNQTPHLYFQLPQSNTTHVGKVWSSGLPLPQRASDTSHKIHSFKIRTGKDHSDPHRAEAAPQQKSEHSYNQQLNNRNLPKHPLLSLVCCCCINHPDTFLIIIANSKPWLAML